MLNYNRKDVKNIGWNITQEGYINDKLGKTEAIFTLGNGYLGVRSSDEETTPFTTRDMFINGVFNQADSNEVTELANIFDVNEVTLKINNETVVFSDLNITDYKKSFDLYSAKLERNFRINFKGINLIISTKRFVSLDNLHLLCQKFSITADSECEIQIFSGINGQVTNSGAQHFYEGTKRLFDDVMHYEAQTYTSKINVAVDSKVEFSKPVDKLILMDRRKIFYRYTTTIKANEEVFFDKITTVCSSFDKQYQKEEEFTNYALKIHHEVSGQSFEKLEKLNDCAWERYWNFNDVKVRGNDLVQLTIRFAMYSLRANTNIFDDRTNIGAKGMTGEGYKGHAFWDTEIFMLPYYIYTNPEAAKNLLKYRYLGLEGAHKKAKEVGYEGAMYPWEAAHPWDGEVTPVWGAADIVTGLPTKIMSGFIEQHITADVAYGMWLYYSLTDDKKFMQDYGYEVILDTAKFWASRVEEINNRYEITNVIGPDEYKEEIDNNAFTNIMAKWNIDLALDYIENEKLEELVEKLAIDIEKLIDVSKNIYVPQINENGILPQNDSFLDLKEIDLTKYKNQKNVGSLFEDYNLDTVNKIQVSKQADVMLLFLLMEDMYSKDDKINNFNFYEPRTLHDSSLSLSSHVVLASDLGLKELTKDLFEKSLYIDLGQNMSTSDHGIHTAAQGGLWQSVIYGLAGIRYHDGLLRVEPHLFDICEELDFNIYYKGQPLHFIISTNECKIKNNGEKIVEIKSNDIIYKIDKQKILKLEIK